MTELTAHADQLLRAHHTAEPLVLPNVWDVASARLVVDAGFPVVATSSRAIAAALGLGDDDSSDPDVIFGYIARVANAVSCPVTADLEAGFRLEPSEFVDRMLDAGVVGCNLEDSNHHSDEVLVDAERQASYLAAVRAASAKRDVHVVVNARVDCFIRHVGDDEQQLVDGTRRAELYLAAGADCVYPIALVDRERIGRFVEAVPGPVNIQARRGGLAVGELATLGVHRISLASGLFTFAQDQVRDGLARLAATGSVDALWGSAAD